MRPRKQILLWAEREEQAGILAFVLKQHPWCAVTKAANDRQFKAQLSANRWDLVIIPHAVSPLRTAHKAALAKRVGRCPVLILAWEQVYPAPWPPEASYVLPYGASVAQVLERVKMLTARKRAPRKKVAEVAA